MKHIRMFENAQQAAAVLAELQYPTLSAIRGESGISMKPGVEPTPPVTKATPFYIDIRGAVTLAATEGLQMSTDRTTWTDTTATTLSSGRIYFRVASDQSTPLKPNWTEDSNSDYDIGGNINSLVKVNFTNDTNCYVFRLFFLSKAKLKSAGDLILPATILDQKCYQLMFNGCTSLTTAPVLPATTMSQYCYYGMFNGCTSLTTAPALPATTLAPYCYQEMFNSCNSLTTAPSILPATTLDQKCYQSMFNGCTSLTTAPELPAATLVKGCYGGMFNNCTNLNYIKCTTTTAIDSSTYTSDWISGVAASGTFVKASGTYWSTVNSYGIPSGWTIQEV